MLPYNDLAAVEAAFEADGDAIAGVIVEPIAGNMNLVLPRPGFLEGLRALCDRHGAVLIFDEVMTGFRVHPRGAQGLYGVTPDLTTLGKVIGGGMPVGAFGGRRAIMERSRRSGPCTRRARCRAIRSPSPRGSRRSRATEAPGFYDALAATTRALTEGLAAAARTRAASRSARSRSAACSASISPRPCRRPTTQVMACDKERFNRFFHAMLDAGVYFAPSAYEAGFVSAAHRAAAHRGRRSPQRRAFAALA